MAGKSSEAKPGRDQQRHSSPHLTSFRVAVRVGQRIAGTIILDLRQYLRFLLVGQIAGNIKRGSVLALNWIPNSGNRAVWLPDEPEYRLRVRVTE